MTTIDSTSPTAPESPDAGESRPCVSVLVADEMSPAGLDRLRALGCRIDVDAELTPKTLPKAMTEFDPDVLLVRSTKVPVEVLDAARTLSLIVRAGAGYDTIDVGGASARGIFVANCPGKNALAVAELAWALILACDRRVPDQTADLRNGVWDKKLYGKARGLFGRTLGIVGLGTIGLAVAERGKAFGMPVLAWSRSLTEEQAGALGVKYCPTPIDVAAQSDVVSIHVASTPETKHLVDDAFCDAMKPGAFLINTTRGAVVDEAALTKAIRERGIRAGLDVFANEPAAGDKTFTDPIVREVGVYGTHHIGASTDQAQEAIGDEAVRVIAQYASTGRIANCVNQAAASDDRITLTVRHLNRPGVLAHVFNALSQRSINVEEMENILYEGDLAACARIRLSAYPAPAQLDEIRGHQSVLSATLTGANA